MKSIHLNFGKTATLVTIILCMTAFNANAQDKVKTISGEVLDMSCYMAKGAKGDGHKDCAAACIKGGAPMGLLTSDGKVYLLVENHDKKDAYAEAKNHAGAQVTVTGTVAEKGGMMGIIVNEVKGKG